MDEKYIVYWWNYDQGPYRHEYDSLTDAVACYNYLIQDEDIGRVSIRWGNTEIQGMITEQYLKESEG